MIALPHTHLPECNEEGFSLVELMVVIVIIGLLATVVIVNVLPSQDQAMRTKAKADIATIEQALEMYRLSNFSYPQPEQGLSVLVSPAAGGALIKRLPNDPWGEPYRYRVPGRQGRGFDVYSLGADRQEGGNGENADIGNWE